MVRIIRKSELPQPDEVPPSLRDAAAAAITMRLREPRPAGVPVLFTSDMQLIRPSRAVLPEPFVQRAHTADTLRTYAEILLDWFDTLERNDVPWATADAVDLVAYRNRMLSEPSSRTHRPYSVRTINHRVRGVLRFYQWAVHRSWIRSSPLVEEHADFTVPHRYHYNRDSRRDVHDREIFLLRQFETLPRPLSGAQACELMARLMPPYHLVARWQIYTGLRVAELLRLSIADIGKAGREEDRSSARVVEVVCKGRKRGYVM